MAWFKCSTELLNRPEFVKLFMPISSRDNSAGYRISCVITLLCQSAEGQFYKDVKHLMAMTGVSIKQAEYVWNALYDEGVLRLDRGMFSAASWLLENGFMAKEKDAKQRTTRNNQRREKPTEAAEQKDEKVLEGEAAERYKAELLRIVGSK